jgi:hypothetical protein
MTVDEMLVQAHQEDLVFAARAIEQRMAADELARLERLSRALARTRAHLGWGQMPAPRTPSR